VRSRAAAEHDGYLHETAFYDSDEQFVSLVEPFLRDGVAAGEPTLVACVARNTALIEEAVDDCDGITFVPGEARYRSPAVTIRDYRETFAALVADGATRIRVVGDVPHPGVGVPWEAWLRYEAAVNHAYADFPLWGLCPYDTRITPDHVLEGVERTHTHVATATGHHENPRYMDPRGLLDLYAAAPDPIESPTPRIQAVDPTPASARRLVEALARESALDADVVGSLVLAVSEIVTNSIRHGRGPHRLRVWTDQGGMVVAVTDAGGGPSDPLTGLLEPDPERSTGRGLWIAHQLCGDVSLRTDHQGFTVRLSVGRPS
jgi:anti-sigma regulatory factor (Ser/Thr protein kinase)